MLEEIASGMSLTNSKKSRESMHKADVSIVILGLKNVAITRKEDDYRLGISLPDRINNIVSRASRAGAAGYLAPPPTQLYACSCAHNQNKLCTAAQKLSRKYNMSSSSVGRRTNYSSVGFSLLQEVLVFKIMFFF